MDTNPRQFERQGNPWHGEGKRIKRGRRKRCARAPLPRLVERSSREACETFVDMRANAKLLALLRAESGKSRTVAPVTEPQDRGIVTARKAPRNVELQPLTQAQRERRGWQRLEFAVDRNVREAAYLASEAFRDAERRRLQAIINAAELQLAKI